MCGRQEQALATVNQRLQWAVKRERSLKRAMKRAGELLPGDLAAGTWWQAPPVARGVSASWGGEEHGSSGVIVIVVADKGSW